MITNYYNNSKFRHRKYVVTEIHTNASLLNAESGATGLFCFEKGPEFKIGPDILRLEESMEDKPAGRASSSPGRTSEKEM